MEVNATPLEVNNKQLLFSVVHDAEERIQAEKALAESEARYRAMFENLYEGIAVYLPVNNGEDFIFADINKAGEKIDSVSKKDLIGRSVREVFPGIKEFGLFDVFQNVWATGEPKYVPLNLYKDKRITGWRSNYVYKLPSGEIVSMYRDETAHKQSEQAHQDSERRYRTLFDNADDAIFVHCFGEEILDVNQSACKYLDYTREELLQMTLKQITSQEYMMFLPQRMASLRQEKRIVFESAHVRRDGEVIPIEGNSSVIEYNKQRAVLTIARDIRERRNAESERRMLRRQLRQAQKTEALGTLAGGIAHDFNNILSPIIGYTDLAMDEASETGSLRSYLEQVIVAAYRARDLVRQILTFSRQGEQEQRPLKVQFIIKEVLKLLRATLPATIEIYQNISKDCGVILADAGQIHQVIMNLCTNAYHAMCEKGGVLELSLKKADIGPNDIPGVPAGAYVKLIVSDTGHGMSREITERIFDPYFTTKERKKAADSGFPWFTELFKATTDISAFTASRAGEQLFMFICR